ncbi:MAG: hypothetical protein HY929_00560 [Euryarchaeota archaeon]|nr:hypothetical protein [Euryarchaeota archaeon]
MVTTVTVNNEMRKKLKKLAAMLDTTQGEVIKKAIELFEKQALQERKLKYPSKVDKILNEASAKIRASDPKWAKISKIIESSTVPIETVIATSWGTEF